MSRHILPEPPAELKRLSAALCGRIRDEIRTNGPMPFAHFMERALYEPGLGYYSAGLHKFGASGDFVTAPETGSLFAACLAGQARELAALLGRYDILEVGAGSGRLAADLLRLLDAEQAPRRYLILERSADLRKVQREWIAAAGDGLLERVQWLDRPPAEDWQGLLLANEVIDALAVERFRVAAGRVEQVCVREADGGFDWAYRPAPAELERAVRALGVDFADGYRSEILLHLSAWLAAMTQRLSRGLALFIDYGYPRSEYYLPERRDGTLMCHYRHRAHDDVFFWPGLQDITAWVDFTALAEAADGCGLEVEGYTSQAMFLLGCGMDRILTAEMETAEDGGLAIGMEAKQLTLPALLGERFKAMGLGRGIERPLRGFSLQDLRHQL
ncbi:MAG: SAM-dependent methyltransferase [Xanthomonadales bacterium]|nr:SAM-dependent methyltransferase [Xanthomonadales bacterium]